MCYLIQADVKRARSGSGSLPRACRLTSSTIIRHEYEGSLVSWGIRLYDATEIVGDVRTDKHICMVTVAV